MRRYGLRVLLFLCTTIALGGAAAPSVDDEPTSKPSGGLSQQAIKRVLDKAHSRLLYCYELELQTRHDLAGKVSIAFVIDDNGAVSDTKISTTTLNNTKAERCMVDVFSTLTFPKPAGGGKVDVTYPMEFKPLASPGCEGR